jgi:hypothetical protein
MDCSEAITGVKRQVRAFGREKDAGDQAAVWVRVYRKIGNAPAARVKRIFLHENEPKVAQNKGVTKERTQSHRKQMGYYASINVSDGKQREIKVRI